MKKTLTLSLAALMSTATLGIATPAAAQDDDYYDRDGYENQYVNYDRDDHHYDRRGEYRQDRRYRSRDYRVQRSYRDRRSYRDQRNYRGYRCDNGTGGTVIGAIAGGLAGHEIAGRGDRTVGTIIGGALGALTGRAIDKSNDGCRR